MSFELALRATEIWLAVCFIQQGLEHVRSPRDEQLLYLTRLGLSLLLLAGIAPALVTVALSVNAVFLLRRFQGPYNGGSDRMGLLILFCLTLAHLLPGRMLSEAAFGYLALQLILSYFVSGYVKILNPEWRNGQALRDVFLFSAYPVSEGMRDWAERPRLLWVMSWAVILFEILFPIAFFLGDALILALIVAALFHLANAVLFGLNRFFWIWMAAYPSLLWLQDRAF